MSSPPSSQANIEAGSHDGSSYTRDFIDQLEVIPFETPPRRRQHGWTPHDPLTFATEDGQPFRLQDAYNKDMRRQLRGWDTRVLLRCGVKIGFVLHVRTQISAAQRLN